jgi:histidyl-tRNA synthetase
MVNQRINSLPKPIKWFSVPRLFRAERPQKGRFREFFQWNIDIIGENKSIADAEIIFATVNYLRKVRLTSDDVKVRISSRRLLSDFLRSLGIPDDKLVSIYAVLDKKDKLPLGTFEKMLKEQIPKKETVKKILDFMNIDSMPQLENWSRMTDDQFAAYDEIKSVLATLSNMGVGDFCVYDPGIVRGLAYYTGIVFEVHAVGSELRAICGGGRFDNLLRDFGGPKVAATGMGMGDCVLEILLREKGLIPKEIQQKYIDYFVALADKVFTKRLYEVTDKLRSMGFSTVFSYKPLSGLSKQLKEATKQNAKECIIIGEEYKNNQIKVKDMATRNEKTVDADEFLSLISRRRDRLNRNMQDIWRSEDEIC